ncbi:hypothetical protein CRUP_020706 [Coryphaenoides rupestris]|nr:hypothetical protein CRUP_020706 [Coryphaenoides rupestris]
MVKVFMDIDSKTSACNDWKISGTAQKNTHYFLVFDAFIILICIASAVLCTRSIVLALRLLQSKFLNGWYVLIIVSDLLAIVGSILKMEIQSKVSQSVKIIIICFVV